MRSLSGACIAAVAAAITCFATPSAQAMTISTPAGLNAAIQQLDVKQDVRCICGHRAYYRPYYSYAYTYQPYYTSQPYYAYAYQPYYAYAPYRPYYSAVYEWPYTYAYNQPYYSYAYVGYGRRHWVGWR